MTSYVALLRAINAGVKLPMPELKAMAERLGYTKARTYIASGNLLFEADADEATATAALTEAASALVGKPVGVTVRTAAELAATVKANPFPEGPGNRVVAIFLDAPPEEGFEAAIRHQGPGEQVKAVGREIFVWYDEGMGQSKLAIPAAKTGTGRNMNTVAKLAEMAAD
ncbi:MAG: hypothetical protein BGN86_04905 [Caulobacterales bacterium 68-7]|nr:DUF1697 domain-containing protein [Caulobacterales bacterium]OJU07589.1 MAG: hypothetical protein BGN86_04905 [Caulobacterales bacterium 68-7]